MAEKKPRKTYLKIGTVKEQRKTLQKIFNMAMNNEIELEKARLLVNIISANHSIYKSEVLEIRLDEVEETIKKLKD